MLCFSKENYGPTTSLRLTGRGLLGCLRPNASRPCVRAVARAFGQAGLRIPWGAFFSPIDMPADYFAILAEMGLGLGMKLDESVLRELDERRSSDVGVISTPIEQDILP